ncbi:dephospho-CoA kinase [Pontibacter ummariensis]|uniref:Dephospho-CoA kinase n=1 Tax=Pontibacter ummariensis TaxID=1610492 RepID=A0A239GU70_9BACT|nr:dephospho-CoA kinase [Pontibacter ummariensis]PRY11023.1 dephospho-CoA kinase [Pontibacter ummariensis]SNS72667.1 dephospho-CoA kinase [Pontibacter ummariensis]
MLKIGITGGIGVGKTVVSRMFALLGIPVYDSDARAKWVMRHDEALRQELVAAFGQETFTEAGELNRSYVASIVFNNPERLEQLNGLVHPHVRQDFESWVKAQEGKPYVLKEAALMYESEAWRQMDQIITVYAPLDVRLKRLLQRDTHRTEEDIRAIIAKQLSEEEKMARAAHVVYNDDQRLVIPQVLTLHAQFLSHGNN